MSECKHDNTIMWEPHLAGARKCKDCGRIMNPNKGRNKWFFEVTDQDIIENLKQKNNIMKKALEEIRGPGLTFTDTGEITYSIRSEIKLMGIAHVALLKVRELIIND